MLSIRCIFLASILLTLAVGNVVYAQDAGPQQVINDYVQSLKSKNCDLVVNLRPGYTLKRCRNIDAIQKVDATLLNKTDDRAIFSFIFEHTQIEPPGNKRFHGYLALKFHKGQWKIGNASFKRIRKLEFELDEYKSWLEENSTVWFSYDEVPMNRLDQAFPTKQPIGAVADIEPVPTHSPPQPAPERPQIETLIESAAVEEREIAPQAKQLAGKKVQLWQAGGPRTFGSKAVLNACWGPQALRGKKGEKRTRNKGPGAYLKGPERRRPRNTIARVPAYYGKSIRRVNTGGKKLVALTFDTGERNNDYAGYDAEIIDYLRRHNIKATFYFGGKWLATHKKRGMQLIADPLFEMGNHAWTHGNLRVIQGKGVRDQVLFTQAQYEVALEELSNMACAQSAGARAIQQIPLQVATFRYPYGTCSKQSLDAVNQMGLPAVQWDVVTSDPVRKQSSQAIANIVLKKTKPGSIVIMHSNGRGWNTGKALPKFIPELKRRGYKFVTISELLRAGKPIATNTCYELRPGDNVRYDKIFGRGTGD